MEPTEKARHSSKCCVTLKNLIYHLSLTTASCEILLYAWSGSSSESYHTQTTHFFSIQTWRKVSVLRMSLICVIHQKIRFWNKLKKWLIASVQLLYSLLLMEIIWSINFKSVSQWEFRMSFVPFLYIVSLTYTNMFMCNNICLEHIHVTGNEKKEK